jgi:plastocyanin
MVVTIPEGSSVQEHDVSFKPAITTVIIGHNSTVRWVNNDIGDHWTEAEKADTAFYSATSDSRIVLKPGQSFEHNFDRPGTYEYHSDPWNRGTIIAVEKTN